MQKISLLLQTVHATVHDYSMKFNYSEPKIYTGGVDVSLWSKLSKEEKQKALKKDWYVYYSFRNPETGKLKRQTNIKGGVNRIKTKQARLRNLRTLQKALLFLLERGFSPYADNTKLATELYSDERNVVASKEEKETLEVIKDDNSNNNFEGDVNSIIKIEDCFAKGMHLKMQLMNSSSFTKYKSRINKFLKWLENQEVNLQSDITNITRRLVNQYLNEVLVKTSARNRNNTRTDLASLFQLFEDNELIKENFIKGIKVLKSIPTRNKTYAPELQKSIFEYMESNNKTLLLFVKFVSYNFLRPIEVCRLRVKDLDVTNSKLSVKAKNSPLKIKIIPKILLDQLPDLSNCNPEDFLFAKKEIGGKWNITEENKRDYYSKEFKKVKEVFNLGSEYGLYSFRHTFISRLYNEMIKKGRTPYEVKSKLMLITGHTSMKALDQYLRNIDAQLPEDYSDLLE